jgi:hypothetical protein
MSERPGRDPSSSRKNWIEKAGGKVKQKARKGWNCGVRKRLKLRSLILWYNPYVIRIWGKDAHDASGRLASMPKTLCEISTVLACSRAASEFSLMVHDQAKKRYFLVTSALSPLLEGIAGISLPGT